MCLNIVLFAGSGVLINVTKQTLMPSKNKENYIFTEKSGFTHLQIKTPTEPAKCENPGCDDMGKKRWKS